MSIVKIVATSVLLLLYVNANCQKIKMNDIYGAIITRPIIPLPSSFTTYSVTTEGGALDLPPYPKIQDPAAKIKLTNFERRSEKADLNIRLIFGGVRLFAYNDGKEIPSIQVLEENYGMDRALRYSLTLGYEVVDQQGVLIQKEMYNAQNVLITTEGSTTSMRMSKGVALSDSIGKHANRCIKLIASRVRELFDTYREKKIQTFFVVKPSKTEQYADFQSAVDRISDAFSSVESEASLVESVTPSIEFWKNKLETFDPKNEEQSQYYFLCAYNLGVIYWILDDFDKALSYAEKSKTVNVRTGMSAMLYQDINREKKAKEKYLAEKDKLIADPSLIYQKNTKEEKPGSIFEVLKPKEKKQTGFMSPGFVMGSGTDTTFGRFIEFSHNLQAGRILFVPTNQEKREYLKPYKDIGVFSLEGVAYFPIAGVLARVVYCSPYVFAFADENRIFFEWESSKKSGDCPIPDPADAASYVINYKKKLAEALAGTCPTVESKILNGDYDLKKGGVEVFLQVIKDVEMNCGTKEYSKYASILERAALLKRYK